MYVTTAAVTVDYETVCRHDNSWRWQQWHATRHCCDAVRV